jgi:hypothetical protein
LFGFILSLIAITYWPTMTVNYAFADDYYCLWNRLYQQNWIYAIVSEGALQARPLNGILVAIIMTGCKSLSDYVSFHAFTILEVAILAYLTFRLLIQSGWTKTQGFFLALSLCSLPPFQVVLCWAVTTFFVLSSILSLLAVEFVVSSEPTFSKQSAKKTILAFTLLLLAIIIYQPWAMFYWVGVAICLTNYSLTDKQRYSYLAKFAAIFFATALVDFLILKIATTCFKHIPVSPERTHLTGHILQKINWFFTGPLVDALNFNHLMVSTEMAIFWGLFIIFGLVIYFNSKTKRQSFLKLSIALAFILLSYLPNLAISESYYTYRTELGLSTLILFYAYLSARAILRKWEEKSKYVPTIILTAIIIVTSIYNLISAHNHVVDFFVKPQMYELQLLKAQLRGECGKEKQLHPVYFERKDTIAPFNRHDEFGMPSFACPWIRDPGTILLKGEISH